MKKITFKIEYSDFLDKELNEYLSSLNGVLFSKVDMKKMKYMLNMIHQLFRLKY